MNIEEKTFNLRGSVKELVSIRRAKLYMKDYLKVAQFNDDIINIPYEVDTKEETLKGILDMLEKFGFKEEKSQKVKYELNVYFNEEENFKAFSQKAYSIRNNNCDEKDFKMFIESVHNNLSNRTLYPLQLLSAFHLAFSQNACNFSVPGAGKTSIVYGAYAYLKNLDINNSKYVDRIVVIGPLSSFGPWENEYYECFGKQPISKRLSGGISRAEKVNHFYSSNPAEVTLLSYQGVLSVLDDLIYFLKRYKVMVILDEAHKIKNTQGGVTAETILSISRYCKSRVILTGTPLPNGYEDLFNLFKFIWPTKDILGYHLYQLKDMSSNPNDERIIDLTNHISPYFIRIRKSDLGIPNPIDNPPLSVKMGTIQREIYDFIEKKYMPFIMSTDNQGVDFKNLLVKARLIRLMQVATNPELLRKPLDEFYSEQGLPNEAFIDDSNILNKILLYRTIEVPQKFIKVGEVVKELIERGEKVIIWTTFIQNIIDLQKYLQSIGIMSELLYGAVPIDKDEDDNNQVTRENIVKEFHREDSIFKVIIANPLAASESISLHKACHNAIYLDRTFNVTHFIQSKDRIHRYGLKETDKTNYYYILSENSIDEVIHERLSFKERRMNEIIENEQIPLFNNIDNEYENEDIKALINRYVSRNL